MLNDGSHLTKCFGCGIGYPIRTKDGMNIKAGTTPKKNMRADGFVLYMNSVGDTVLRGILPKTR